MYLFKDQEEITIPFICKSCLKEIKLVITAEEYKNTTEFPIRKENIHGEPPHKLIVFFDKNLEIANFNIEDIIEKDVSYSRELTRQVLSEIELSDEEIELYFLTTGRPAVSLGEISILIDKPKEECETIAEKFVQKGLYKKVIGGTPHYTALPPYAALISQLKNFNSFISDIIEKVPPQLKQSLAQMESKAEGVKKLKDYSDFMNNLKEDMLSKMSSQKTDFENSLAKIDKIKAITEIIGGLEDETRKIMETQIENLSKKFNDIQKKISLNLKNLRLGVIQKTVEQIIQKVFEVGLEEINKEFNELFILKLNKILGTMINNMNDITNSTAQTGENMKNIFGNISINFNKTIIMAEEKLSGISEAILKSFSNLRNDFSIRVIKTFEDVLKKILNRLEISDITTREFWDRSKRVSQFTMRDIWFIGSIESAKAHINEQISKAKMRLLIITPQLTDIDVNALQKIPKFINIRIATNIDLYVSDHVAILQELDQMQNVTYRHREMQNLWGVNKDYEEVILCVVSKSEVGGKEITEIAGIGSIIEEHIKIFAPILEEAWIGARKEIFHALERRDIKPSEQIRVSPQSTQPSFQSKKIEIKGQIETRDKIETRINIEPQKQEPMKTAQSASVQTQIPEKKIIQQKEIITSAEFESAEITTLNDLANYFEFIKHQLEKKTGVEISKLIGELHDAILKIKGFSGVLIGIKNSIPPLTTQLSTLNNEEQKGLEKKLNFWKKKINL